MPTDRRLSIAGDRSKHGELRIGLTGLLTAAVFLFASAAFADIVLLVGPDGVALPAGSYRLVTIPSDGDQPVSEVKIVVGSGPVKPPVIVPPVTPDPKPPDPPVTPDPPDPPPLPQATAAVYVWEKDQAAVPAAVATALQRLNNDGSGIVASDFDQDTVTGTGTVPKQYAVALEAAKKAGIPCLVVLAGEQVVRVITKPTTEAQVLEAV